MGKWGSTHTQYSCSINIIIDYTTPLGFVAAQKSDVWLAVDPVSGTKLHTYTSGGDISSTCSLSDVSGSVLHIARTGIVQDGVSSW